ncbi:MAG: RES domain-containing protein [Rhizobiaceae bacterium]|nr:RES domain-containing protein [Rhizobiaceae bacterium]
MPEIQSRHTLWRAFVPRWAHLPLSGEGAARFGGRWNPVGHPTIYAAFELSTAWAEYNQSFVQHPALIAQLELRNARLADLTSAETLERWGVTSDIHQCEWRDLVDRELVPPTYELRERLLAEGWHGVIYPSHMSRGGTCAALWRWNGEGAPSLEAVDPDHRLPTSAASWL